MIRVVICILAVSATTLAAKSSSVPQGKYPAQVSLRHVEDGHRCAGSILNEKWLLTSALCLNFQSPSEWWVYAGDVDLEGSGQTHTIAQIIVHEEYDNGLNIWNINNIALVEVENPFVFSENVQPVTLPEQNQDTMGGPATLIGWGSYEKNVTRLLQELDVTSILTDIECVERCGDYVTYPVNICTKVPQGTVGLRFGDVGGPLFSYGVQVGIMSWAPSTQCSDDTCFYTDVCKFIDWINSKIN